jgi:monoamine oxidase
LAHLKEDQLIAAGVASLADIFKLPPEQLKRGLVAARAINWENDPFARGAYSYATVETRQAQASLANSRGDRILISGEALYCGRDMGTVEAALAVGLETARTILVGTPT